MGTNHRPPKPSPQRTSVCAAGLPIYTMFNSVARAHWGDCTGRRPEDLCPDEATLALWQSNNRRALAGEVVRGEVQMAPHGEPGYYYNIVSPIRDGEEIRGILGVNIDITPLKRAEAALQRAKDGLELRVKERTAALEAEVDRRRRMELDLRESEQKYRTLVESAGDAIATVTQDGEILFVNDVLARRFGASAEGMVDKRVQDFFPQPFADEQVALIRQAIHTGRAVKVTVLAPVAEPRRWFNVTFEPLSMGRTPAALVVARDIDDLVRARQQVEDYREQMARADRLASLGTMSAMVAHELTQPLTVLRLSIQNALEAAPRDAAPTVIEDLQGCVEEVTAMTGIVERFRGFARSSSPRQLFDVDLSVVADQMIRLTAEAARSAQVEVSVRGLEALPRFRARAKDMEQLFFALLMNAIQAADGSVPRSVVVHGSVGANDDSPQRVIEFHHQGARRRHRPGPVRRRAHPRSVRWKDRTDQPAGTRRHLQGHPASARFVACPQGHTFPGESVLRRHYELLVMGMGGVVSLSP
jgi:PAS domain S-box-containing protein